MVVVLTVCFTLIHHFDYPVGVIISKMHTPTQSRGPKSNSITCPLVGQPTDLRSDVWTQQMSHVHSTSIEGEIHGPLVIVYVTWTVRPTAVPSDLRRSVLSVPYGARRKYRLSCFVLGGGGCCCCCSAVVDVVVVVVVVVVSAKSYLQWFTD